LASPSENGAYRTPELLRHARRGNGSDPDAGQTPALASTAGAGGRCDMAATRFCATGKGTAGQEGLDCSPRAAVAAGIGLRATKLRELAGAPRRRVRPTQTAAGEGPRPVTSRWTRAVRTGFCGRGKPVHRTAVSRPRRCSKLHLGRSERGGLSNAPTCAHRRMATPWPAAPAIAPPRLFRGA
jgi:hypothetical protein